MLINVCWRYAANKEQAVEYMNLGFVKILLNLKQYKLHVPFDLWAKRVMINCIFNEFKKNKTWTEKTVDIKEATLANVGSDSETSAEQDELIDLIKTKVLQLPPMTAKVFNLYAIDGYMHNEISSLLGISEGTSAWHYSEAKKRIRQMIGVNTMNANNGK